MNPGWRVSLIIELENMLLEVKSLGQKGEVVGQVFVAALDIFAVEVDTVVDLFVVGWECGYNALDTLDVYIRRC